MLYEILDIVIKKPDWKVATVRGLDGITLEGVSINKTDQKGDIAFPEFDTLITGSRVEATYWESPKGAKYLFPPKKKANPTFRMQQAEKLMEVKAANVDKSQDKKELGIMVSSTMDHATTIALASLAGQPFPTDAEFKAEFEKWRLWFLAEWKRTRELADVPF